MMFKTTIIAALAALSLATPAPAPAPEAVAEALSEAVADPALNQLEARQGAVGGFAALTTQTNYKGTTVAITTYQGQSAYCQLFKPVVAGGSLIPRSYVINKVFLALYRDAACNGSPVILLNNTLSRVPDFNPSNTAFQSFIVSYYP